MANPRIRIRNDQNRIVFMNEGPGLQLVDKGVVYTTRDPAYRIGNTSPSVINVPTLTSDVPRLIATRAGFYVAKYATRVINGITHASFSCSVASDNQPVEYWIFQEAVYLDTPGTGLKMRNPETGQVIYNSDYDSCRMSDIPPVVVGSSMTYIAGRKYASIMPSIAGHNQTTDALLMDGRPVIDKEDGGSGGSHNWSRRNDGKLYGVRWINETFDIGTVSFDDVIVAAPGYANEPDPQQVWWSNPINRVIVVDVTAL